MSKISRRELKEIDFDWYCLINDIPAHFASMGGLVPSIFCERNELRALESSVLQLPYICEIELTEQIVSQEIESGYDYLTDNQLDNFGVFVEDLFAKIPSFNYNKEWNIRKRLYTSSFVDKARRGFYSYARIGNENKYALIAKPQKTFDWKSHDLKLRNLILQDKLNLESIDLDFL